MAINPSTRYPGKVDAPNANYPYGGARDVSLPGAGDGTPWEEGLANDLFGFWQKLLSAAGITPTGNPETVLASQYMEALTALFAATAETTTSLLARDLAGVSGLSTLGYSAAGDGGGAQWLATGVTTPGKAATTEFNLGFLYDVNGVQFKILPGELNVRAYGAVGDGVTNDQAAIQNAISTQNSRGGGGVLIPTGTFFCNSQVTMQSMVSVRGISRVATTVTFAGAAGSFPGGQCMSAGGTTAVLPALAANVAPGDQTITFVSPHGLIVGDLFSIEDTRANSYANYPVDARAGEYFVVSKVVSTTVVLVTTSAYATTNPSVNFAATTYDAAQVTTRKFVSTRVALRDMTLIGVSPTSTVAVVGANYGRDCVYSRLIVHDSGNFLMLATRSYSMRFSDITLAQASDAGPLNIGIAITHCQRVFITRVQGGATGSSIRAYVGSTTIAVPNREISITDCFTARQGDNGGDIRLESNCEHCVVADSHLKALILGGDHHRVSDCTIRTEAKAAGKYGEGWGLHMLGMTGLNVHISNCKFIAGVNVSASYGLLNWADTTSVQYRNGTLRISDCEFNMAGKTGQTMRLLTRGNSILPVIRISDCRFEGDNTATGQSMISAAASSGWLRAEIIGCSFFRTQLYVMAAETTVIRATEVLESPAEGIYIDHLATNPFPSTIATFIDGCTVYESETAGIRFRQNGKSYVSDTTSLNNNQSLVASAVNSSLAWDPGDGGTGTTNLRLHSNVFGDDASSPTQTHSHYYINVDHVIESGSTLIGGLPASRSATVEEFGIVYDEDDRVIESNAKLGLSGADPRTAPTNIQDLVIGTGTNNHGIALKTTATGENVIASGDASDIDRHKLIFQHTAATRRLIVHIDATNIFSVTTAGLVPLLNVSKDVGSSSFRWKNLYGGFLHADRLFFTGAPGALDGDIGTLVNWGGSTTTSVTGRESNCVVTVNNGTGASGAPRFRYTWQGLSQGATKIPNVFVTGLGSPHSYWAVHASTETYADIAFQGTPVDSTTYKVQILLVWPVD